MDIINAIKLLVEKKFPGMQVNISRLIEGFDRPSFFITHIYDKTDQLNRFVFNDNILIRIFYFAYLDEHKNVDAVDQYNTYDILKDIFKDGYFMVGDRAVKIRQMHGRSRDEKIYLTLSLDITEERNVIPEVQPATEIKVNVNEKE